MELILFAVLLHLGVTYSALPEYIHACKKSDPQINDCIKHTIQDLRPKLIEGMPELNVPSIEPLIIDELIATEGSGLKVTTRSLKVFGGSNFTIISIDVDVDNNKFEFEVAFDHLFLEGKYDVDGKIIMIPIKGNGDLTADVYDVKTKVKLNSEIETIDGVKYIRFPSMSMDFAIGKGKVHLDNLFGGDKLIGDVINAAINLNFQYFLKELNPTIVTTLSDFILKSARQIVDKAPLDEAFPQ